MPPREPIGSWLRPPLPDAALHGLAGDVMREGVGEHSLVATDLLRGLPEAFLRARKAAQEKLVRWDG